MWKDYGLERPDVAEQKAVDACVLKSVTAVRRRNLNTRHEFSRLPGQTSLEPIVCDLEAVRAIDQLKRALRNRISAGRHYSDTPLCNALDDALDELIGRFGLSGTPGHWAGIDHATLLPVKLRSIALTDGFLDELTDPMTVAIQPIR